MKGKCDVKVNKKEDNSLNQTRCLSLFKSIHKLHRTKPMFFFFESHMRTKIEINVTDIKRCGNQRWVDDVTVVSVTISKVNCVDMTNRQTDIFKIIWFISTLITPRTRRLWSCSVIIFRCKYTFGLALSSCTVCLNYFILSFFPFSFNFSSVIFLF